ncbi:hypothetical protein ACTPOK_01110 [Streptomyces inhibens]
MIGRTSRRLGVVLTMACAPQMPAAAAPSAPRDGSKAWTFGDNVKAAQGR